MASLREMLAAALEANGRWELAAAELREENARQSAELERVSAALQVSRWLEREGLGAGELTGEQAGRFVASRRAAGRAAWVSPQSMALLLGYLRALGVAPVPAPALAQGPLEELPTDYRRYLRMERGLSEHTVLMRTGRPHGCSWRAKAPGRSVSGAQHLVCALRSLLRYLRLAGLIRAPLAQAVPSVADLRDRTLPRGLDQGR